MNQDEIFKLLLIILLLSNEKDNDGCERGCNRYSNLNEIILVCLLMNACNGNNGCPNLNNGGTSF